LKKLLLTIALALLVPAAASAQPTVSGANHGNIDIKVWTDGNAQYVNFHVRLRSATASPAPGVSVMFSDCNAGLGLPVGPEPVSSSHNAGSLFSNKISNIQWDVDRLPPVGSVPYLASLRYTVPRHSVPYSVCLKASFAQLSTGYRWSANMRFFLKPAKSI